MTAMFERRGGFHISKSFRSDSEEVSTDITPSTPSSHLFNDVGLTLAIENFATSFEDYIEPLIAALYAHRNEMPHEMQVSIFGIIGRYLHTFSNILNNTDHHYSLAHQLAVVEVMSDPSVSQMVEGILENFVRQNVSYFVEGGE